MNDYVQRLLEHQREVLTENVSYLMSQVIGSQNQQLRLLDLLQQDLDNLTAVDAALT